VRFGAGLDHVILFDLLVEERVEGALARAEGVDLTHQREYRKSAFSADMERVRKPFQVPCGSCWPASSKPLAARLRARIADAEPHATTAHAYADV
jgi:hypothetical protein